MGKNKYCRVPLVFDRSKGRHEVMLAEEIDTDLYKIVSIPAYVYGVGMYDTVRVLDSRAGEFEVVVRGGQVAIRVYVVGSLDNDEIAALIDNVVKMDGVFEVGANSDKTSLLLISLSTTLGRNRIAELTNPFNDRKKYYTEFGNQYDADGSEIDIW